MSKEAMWRADADVINAEMKEGEQPHVDSLPSVLKEVAKAPVVDMDQLLENVDELDFAVELLIDFVAEGVPKLEEVFKTMANFRRGEGSKTLIDQRKTIVVIRGLTHSLKGSALNVRANRVGITARALELPMKAVLETSVNPQPILTRFFISEPGYLVLLLVKFRELLHYVTTHEKFQEALKVADAPNAAKYCNMAYFDTTFSAVLKVLQDECVKAGVGKIE